MPVDTSSFYSVVKNTSGVARHFSFLPNGGRTLEPNEEYSYFGDIRNEIGRKAGSEPSSARRDREAFIRAIADGALSVITTPAPIFRDLTLDEPRTISIDNELLSVIDPYAPPTLESSSSSSSA